MSGLRYRVYDGSIIARDEECNQMERQIRVRAQPRELRRNGFIESNSLCLMCLRMMLFAAVAESIEECAFALEARLLTASVPRVSCSDFVIANFGARSATMRHV
jgi:hypothetical protein